MRQLGIRLGRDGAKLLCLSQPVEASPNWYHDHGFCRDPIVNEAIETKLILISPRPAFEIIDQISDPS